MRKKVRWLAEFRLQKSRGLGGRVAENTNDISPSTRPPVTEEVKVQRCRKHRGG